MERAAVNLDRTRAGLSARGLVLYGLRGVGKTVLLDRIRQDAEARGFATLAIEAPEGRSLPAALAPALRASLLRLSRGEALRDGLKRAMEALASFVRSLKLQYADMQMTVDMAGPKGVADSGDLESDLRDLLEAAGQAARERGTGLLLAIDELQYVPEPQLAALIAALHDIAQKQLPVSLIAAGLPQLLGQMGRAKSYAERLFEFAPIDRLAPEAAVDALCKPAARQGVAFTTGAIDEILVRTEGYAYFLQEWGQHSWAMAAGSPITLEDASRATAAAIAELDESFFRVRFDRLTPAERRYLRAMAELGPGPSRSGDVADRLGRKVTSIGPTRGALIAKGMVYGPAHGDTAFTVPLFDAFMKRAVPFP